ncbi:hypothetical protein LCGC14_1242440 [marine sediment metagenome]|uniref:Uncharacterized protein n=1 Tax=marine sediment metagenome TaxID=412755 RepID=A0A0F9LSN7_9ZZZZ
MNQDPRPPMMEIYCPDCGNKIGRRRPDGQIIVRWKGRVVRADSCVITCEECGTDKELDEAATLDVI